MIKRVAVRLGKRVFVGADGKRHDSVITEMILVHELSVADSVNGFIDDKGNFLNRREAAKHAFECGQLPNDKTCPEAIMSEDLW